VLLFDSAASDRALQKRKSQMTIKIRKRIKSKRRSKSRI
jgi:hypothetical protein